MRTIIIALFTTVIGLFACTKETVLSSADTQLVGHWKLIKITYGFSQVSTTPEKAGYSETIEFNTDGTYRRLTENKDGQKEEKGRFYTDTNPSKTAEAMAIFFPDLNVAQPYSFRDGHLFLYERTPVGATIADGSTYEYSKQ
ncbi:hypothetical protein HNV11_23270 [Spirosoma taeanense]|uniref:Lipocalin-like domain-containing protein n=1 Tax=Spirosoma taeanense TaxID=2735870 RepID=A0A6M5YFL4_9BACT|nr:hypothetical protein [Spirosoma taeanense]QJW92086.1 hypothetical protein HNV11_23270 [Spirosoma taeanense]